MGRPALLVAAAGLIAMTAFTAPLLAEARQLAVKQPMNEGNEQKVFDYFMFVR
jgi:hypothetical protein